MKIHGIDLAAAITAIAGTGIVIAMIIAIAQGYARDKRRWEAHKLPCAGNGDCVSCTNWESCSEY